MPRVSIKSDAPKADGAYLEVPPKVEFFPSGSTLLDLVLGGGWACGRGIHLIGNSSTGKTQLATEAMANFRRKFPDAPVVYFDMENAYDEDYGRKLGLPPDIKPKDDVETIEEWVNFMEPWLEALPDKGHALAIVDSFDAVSDDREQERDVTEGTYGGDKPRLYSGFCRKYKGLLRRKGVTLIIISQVRDNVGGGPWGQKEKVAGGRALKFYASQQIWLHHVKRLSKTSHGIDRELAVVVKAKNEKNKVGPPFQECEFPIVFDFGVDDVYSMASFLHKYKQWKLVDGLTEAEIKKVISLSFAMDTPTWKSWRKRLRGPCRQLWRMVDQDLGQNKKKYV